MVRSSSLNDARKFLRKQRKWPLSPFKAKWHLAFNQQQAMQNLKQSLTTPPPNPQQQENSDKPHILSSLIHSFSIYNCDPTPRAYHFIIKTLANTSQLHQVPLVLDHLERVDKFETPEYIFTDIIRIYGNSGRIQDAVDIFYRIPKFRCIPTVYSLNTLLSVLCRHKEGLKMVHKVLIKSQAMNIRLEESTFGVLITTLCKINKVDYAVKIVHCMIDDGFDVDARFCSFLLNSICEQKCRSGSEVMGFLEALKKTGFCPGIRDYTNVMRLFVNKGRQMDALGVLEQMISSGIKPDIVCYTIVLKGLVREGDYGKADDLFDEMLIMGLTPDVYAYNVYIDGLCKQNKFEAATKMVTCMEDLGCQPNVITYNTLLKALCKAGEISTARELVKEMESKSISSNLQTYKVMIDGLVGKGQVLEACNLLEEVLSMGLYPHSSTVDEVICQLCQKGMVDNALEILRMIIDRSISPGGRVWETLLLGSGSKLKSVDTTLVSLVDPMETYTS